MGVQGIEACKVDKEIDYRVNRVAYGEGLTYCFDTQVSVDLAKLRYDEFVIDTDVDEEKDFVNQVQR